MRWLPEGGAKPRAEGANGAPPAGGAGRLPRFGSGGVDQVKLAVKEFFRGAVIQHLPWQTVDAIGKKADLIGGIIGYAPTLRNEPPQQPIVAFIRSFLKR